MPYDLFISYSRNDDLQGRITQLIGQIRYDFEKFAGRPLAAFFDVEEIHGMEDWRHRILQGLHESRLLLACLSPSYIQSDYCEWEFNEYIKHEIDLAYFADGVAPIYFVEVPGWQDKDFEKKCGAWLIELRRRQYFDLRPWFNSGEESLRDVIIKQRMALLNAQIKERVVRFEHTQFKTGNIDSHNLHFIGRTSELRKLRETVALGKLGVLTAIHGLGGIGKTALAIEYANVFSHEYGGGCWQVRCEGKQDLLETISGLAAPLALEFNEEEKKSIDHQFQRVMTELHNLAFKHEPNRCLLLLDNVDNPKLLEPSQTKYLPAAEWLNVIATTRLGESDLFWTHKDRTFIPVDEMPECDALELIKTYQPSGSFLNESEQEAAREIVKILDCFTLAVEMSAVYLGQYSSEITCSGFLSRLKKEGLAGLDRAATHTAIGLRHGEKCLAATLNPTLEHLTEPERLALKYAALLPSDYIALPWIRTLISEEYPAIGRDSEPGYPDPWKNLLRHLLGFRLFQGTGLITRADQMSIVKMHRIVGQVVLGNSLKDAADFLKNSLKLSRLIYYRSIELSSKPVDKILIWELDCLYKTIQIWLNNNRYMSQSSAVHCASALRDYGLYKPALELAEMIIDIVSKNKINPDISIIWCHNLAGVAALHMDNTELAEYHFFSADRLAKSQGTNDLDRLDTLTNVGCLYRNIYRPDLALGPLKNALEIAEKRFGKDSREAGIRCINLGLVMQDLCNLKEAIPLFQRAVEIDSSHPGLVLSACQDLSTLAEALRNAGQLDDAEIKARKAYDLAQKYGLEQHPVSMNIKINLASVLEEKERFVEAEELFESARDIAIKCYGENSPSHSLCLNNLGALSIFRGNMSKAVENFNNSLKIELDQKMPNKQRIAHRELNIGIAQLLAGDPVESLMSLYSGWDHKTETGRPDLLTARLLLARLAVSFLLKGKNDLFIGQLNTLLSEDMLTASGINVKWSLEKPFKLMINRFSQKQINQWNMYCQFVNSRVHADSNRDLNIPNDLLKRNLNEKWPDIKLYS
jgi:tetratricopeptide (TPR) repeat protein